MGNHTNCLLDTTLNEFVCPKFRIGDHCIPCVSGIRKATDPVVGVHRHVAHELKAKLLVQIMDLGVLVVDDPTVVDCEDYIRLLNLYDLADAVLTKGTVLESIGSWVDLVGLLQGIRITMPVTTQDYNFIFIFQPINHIVSDACKTSGGNYVTNPKKLRFFSH